MGSKTAPRQGAYNLRIELVHDSGQFGRRCDFQNCSFDDEVFSYMLTVVDSSLDALGHRLGVFFIEVEGVGLQ